MAVSHQTSNGMKVVLAADHRGFAFKEELKKYLEGKGYDVEDVGAHALDPEDDYPDFGFPASRMVASVPDSKGILICGSGMGMDVVANKVRGIRATIAHSPESAAHGVSHDGINIITLAADTCSEDEARAIVETFLATPFSSEEKYHRRMEKISAIEDQYFR